MNSISRTVEYNNNNKSFRSQQLKNIRLEESKNNNVVNSNLYKENALSPSYKDSSSQSLKKDASPIGRPKPKRSSFSDILAPHDIQTEANLSLERELEKNMHKSLNIVQLRSNVFEESSIHKDQNNPVEALSGFDMREHDIFLNDHVTLEMNNQTNKKICVLCHNSAIVKTLAHGSRASEERKEEDELIYPCLCSIRAHRDCLKAYILAKKVMVCERCKAAYAVSGKKRKDLRMTKEEFGFTVIVLSVCVGIMVIGVILTALGFKSDAEKVGLGVVGVIMMVIGLIGILFLAWRQYLSKKNVDIFVNCKQTEIARHEDEPERIVRRFIDQEEKKRGSSSILKKAKKLLSLLDVTEFENFIRLTTPRVDKDGKEIIRYERRGSSNYLLPDINLFEKDEKAGKQTQKEIFISPDQFERSEITVIDHKSNMNERSSPSKSPDLPKIKISLDLPTKNFQISSRTDIPKKPEIQQPKTYGSQSERVYSQKHNQNQGINLHPIKLLKLPFKEPPSALSMSNQNTVNSPQEKGNNNPEYIMSLPEY